jgi:hypothetical protein
MNIKLRGKVWHIDMIVKGEPLRRSLCTSDKKIATQRANALIEAAWTGQLIKKSSTAQPTDAGGFPANAEPQPSQHEEVGEDIKLKFGTDAELHRFVALFNEITVSPSWQETDARKDHTDEFGAPILSGEMYFSRHPGPAFHSVQRLSKRSMDTMLHFVFNRNSLLEELAVSRHEKGQAECVAVLNTRRRSS